MSLRRRLEKLEAGDGRCPECGGPWRPGDPVEYIVEWEDPPTPEKLREYRGRREAGLPVEDPATREPAREPLPPCPRCGCEREIVVVDWPDAPTPKELAKLEARRFGNGAVPDYPSQGRGGGGTT